MPDGFQHSPERWQRATAPLEEIEDEWAAFAAEHGLAVSCNDRKWPERSLSWHGKFHRKIQLYLADEKTLTFNLSVYAWQDDDRGRRWLHRPFLEAIPWSDIRPRLGSLLQTAYEIGGAIREEDLRPV